ncbi:hypothetical protein [Methanopyrus kandleri]
MTLSIALTIVATLAVATPPVAAQSAGPLTVSESSNANCPPWVDPAFLSMAPCLGHLEFPHPSGDRFLLVAPLWREGDHYRAILGVYGVGELALPRGAKVYRVLVPSRVEWERPVYWQVVTYAPWHEVQYSLQESDGLPRLRPEKTVDRTFVVEASLPAHGEWVRIVLTPGNWIVALGWTLDFNVLTLDGRVLFQGRHPYDEVEYDLPDGVYLAFWVFWYALDLGGRWGRGLYWADVPWRFDPRWQYEHGVFYGYCTVLEVRASKPLILEFKAPEPGVPLESPVTLVLQEYEFVTRRYIDSHLTPPIVPGVVCRGSEGRSESEEPEGRTERRTVGLMWVMAVVAVLVALAPPTRRPHHILHSVNPGLGSGGSGC